jgi:hypothetical protein
MALDYSKLRQLCLQPLIQTQYPDWPFPLLFHGYEITRDFSFLDPLLEFHIIDLGKNRVPDAASLSYPYLNAWFHYRFFNGTAPVINTADAVSLLPRLIRLRRKLLDGAAKPEMARYLKQELSVGEPEQLILNFLLTVAQLIKICTEHDIIVWGKRCNAGAAAEQNDYIKKIVSEIRVDLRQLLRHVHEQFCVTQIDVFNVERDLLLKAEARYERRLKGDERASHHKASSELQDALNHWNQKY